MSESTRNKTVLGPDCRISGELTLDNDAVIMGQFKGTLRVSGLLELTESSEVAGTIIAGSLRLAGKAEADVVAEMGLELLPGAMLTGQVYTNNINVSEGATFQGDVCVGPKAIQAAAEVLSQSEPAEALSPRPSMAMSMGKKPSNMMQPAMQQPMHHDEEEMDHDDAGEAQTMPGSVNQILQRRRAKVLAARQTVSNGHH